MEREWRGHGLMSLGVLCLGASTLTFASGMEAPVKNGGGAPPAGEHYREPGFVEGLEQQFENGSSDFERLGAASALLQMGRGSEEHLLYLLDSVGEVVEADGTVPIR